MAQPHSEPDWEALQVIGYELDLALEKGLTREEWQKLYERAVEACRGQLEFTEFIVNEAAPGWL